jgi:uncharacterized repeat protein (TIGR02543 family)
MLLWGMLAMLLAAVFTVTGCDMPNKTADPEKFTVTFDANADGATVQGNRTWSTEVESGKTMSVLPTPDNRTGYGFVGWFTKNGVAQWGVQFDTIFPVTKAITLYAQWKTAGSPDPEMYTVTFNADGGSVAPAKVKVSSGESLGDSLPAATRSGFTFGGWYTAQDGGGTAFTGNTNVTADITVYAKWTQNSGGNNSPKILVITGFPDPSWERGDVYATLIAPVGTAISNLQDKYVATAGNWEDNNITHNDVSISNGTATVQLKKIDSTSAWTGSGTFDVWIAPKGTIAGASFYKAANVSITTATTTIAASQFTFAGGGGGGNTDPKSITITGIPAEYRGKWFTTGVSGINGYAYNEGTNSSDTQTFALKDLSGNNWTGSGECYLVIRTKNGSDDGGGAKDFYYTNGANFTAQSESIPTYNISQAVSTIAFSKFFDVTSILDADAPGSTGGTTPKSITITGIPASYNNNNIDIMIMRVVDIPISQVLYHGSAAISNGSAAAALTTWDDQPFTGSGKYSVVIKIGERYFTYTNGASPGSMSDSLYTINENQAESTIAFSKFADITAYYQNARK